MCVCDVDIRVGLVSSLYVCLKRVWRRFTINSYVKSEKLQHPDLFIKKKEEAKVR